MKSSVKNILCITLFCLFFLPAQLRASDDRAVTFFGQTLGEPFQDKKTIEILDGGQNMLLAYFTPSALPRYTFDYYYAEIDARDYAAIDAGDNFITTIAAVRKFDDKKQCDEAFAEAEKRLLGREFQATYKNPGFQFMPKAPFFDFNGEKYNEYRHTSGHSAFLMCYNKVDLFFGAEYESSVQRILNRFFD